MFRVLPTSAHLAVITRRWMAIVGAVCACGALVLATGSPAVSRAAAPRALILELDGIVAPASSDFIVRGIEQAERDAAELVVLRINTPGGLDSLMRDIIKKILASAAQPGTEGQ